MWALDVGKPSGKSNQEVQPGSKAAAAEDGLSGEVRFILPQ